MSGERPYFPMSSCRKTAARFRRQSIASVPFAASPVSLDSDSPKTWEFPEDRKKQLKITDNLVRISIGFEDPGDLIDAMRR